MTRARTLWEEGTEPGRQVVVLGIAATLTAVGLDMLVNGRLTLLFDLVFVATCLACALLVRPRDFFTVGVLPPLLMLGAVWLLALVDPDTVAHASDGTVQAVVTGLARHATALVTGYGLTLFCLGMRTRVYAARRRERTPVPEPRAGQDSKRVVSPAPWRSTSGAPSE